MKSFNISGLVISLSLMLSFPSWAGEIHEAVENQNIRKVKKLLNKDPQLIHSKDDKGRTPWMIAIDNRDPNLSNHIGKDRDQNLALLKLLLLYGADINDKSSRGETLLTIYEEEDVFNWLLNNNADVNAKGNNGETALLYEYAVWACFASVSWGSEQHIQRMNESKNRIEKLVALGANINAKDNHGHSILHHFYQDSSDKNNNYCGIDFENQRKDEVKELLDFSLLHGLGSIANAIELGRFNVVQSFIDKDPMIVNENIYSDHTHTPLRIVEDAIFNFNKHYEDISRMEDKDFIWSSKEKRENHDFDRSRADSLVRDANDQYREIEKLLIEKGADINKAGIFNDIVKRGDMTIISFAISHGAKIDPLALSVSIEGGHQETIEYLLTKGLNVNVADKEGRTPLMVAITKGASQDILNHLIANGANINAVDISGNSVLHYAVDSKEPATLNLLISLGAKLNVKNKAGKTPLKVAIEKNDWEKVNILKAHGAAE